MNIEEKIRNYLRQASNFGERGLGYDFDKEEVNEDWQDFEDKVVEELIDEANSSGSSDDWEPIGCHGLADW